MEDGGQSRERLELFGERHVTPTFTMSEYLEIQIYEQLLKSERVCLMCEPASHVSHASHATHASHAKGKN